MLKILQKRVYFQLCEYSPVDKITFDTQNTAPYCQKYTPTDRFFRDFAHWEIGQWV